MVKNENLLIPAAGRPQIIAFSMNEDVNSCHVDPGFLHDDPPRLSAIRVRA